MNPSPTSSPRRPSPRRPLRRAVGATVVGLALVAGLGACGGDDDPVADATSAAGDPATSSTAAGEAGASLGDVAGDSSPDGGSAAGDDGKVSAEGTAELCAPGEGKTITELPDVVIEPVEVPAVVTEEETLGGRTEPGVDIPAVTIPGATLDGGCYVEFAAPAGCLGAVEISGVEIPEVTIPAVSVPAAFDEEGDAEPAVTVAAVSIPAVRVEQVCQETPDPDATYQPGIYRPSAYRESAYRPSAYRPALYRSSSCEQTECSESLRVEGVRVDGVRVQSVRVPSDRLEGEELDGLEGVPVYGDSDTTAILAPADVLFDQDSADLKPEAAAVLQVVAAEITAAGSGARITVEGHTSSEGDEGHNQDLSERRARAVADWLVAEGGIAEASVTVTGLGETTPVASNDTEDGRARNRRVVIGVADA